MRAAQIDQLVGVFLVNRAAFGLDVRTVRSADVGTFVVFQADHFHRFVDDVDRAGDEPFLIGVFDAQDELAARAFGNQIFVQSGSEVSDVHVARRGRGESASDFHRDNPFHKNV